MHITMQDEEYMYNDGGKFSGLVKQSNGLPSTTGKLVLADSSTYNGMFNDGMFHGRGVLTMKDGEKYEGEFQNGKFHGMGKFTKPGKFVFCGEFRDGSINGKGLMTYSDQSKSFMKRQEGTFENGVLMKAEPCRSVIDSAEKISRDAGAPPR